MSAMSRDELIQAVFTSADLVQRRWKDYILENLSLDDLSLTQLTALFSIGERGVMTSSALAQQLMVTPGAVTQIVDGLQSAGYVRRDQDAGDRRVVNVTLTALGAEQIDRLNVVRKEGVVRIFADVSDDELAAQVVQQNKILQKLNEINAIDAVQDPAR